MSHVSGMDSRGCPAPRGNANNAWVCPVNRGGAGRGRAAAGSALALAALAAVPMQLQQTSKSQRAQNQEVPGTSAMRKLHTSQVRWGLWRGCGTGECCAASSGCSCPRNTTAGISGTPDDHLRIIAMGRKEGKRGRGSLVQPEKVFGPRFQLDIYKSFLVCLYLSVSVSALFGECSTSGLMFWACPRSRRSSNVVRHPQPVSLECT